MQRLQNPQAGARRARSSRKSPGRKTSIPQECLNRIIFRKLPASLPVFSTDRRKSCSTRSTGRSGVRREEYCRMSCPAWNTALKSWSPSSSSFTASDCPSTRHRVCQLFFCRLELNKSEIDSLLGQLSREWKEELDTLCELILLSLIVYMDETGWRVGKGNCYTWIFTTALHTVLLYG